MGLYKLENGKPVRVTDLIEWAKWRATADRSIKRTEISTVGVSTVFLGSDRNVMGAGPAVLFETMIFGGQYDQFCWRYCTLGEAKQGHFRIVADLKAGRQP
jgi:hypothetical protein